MSIFSNLQPRVISTLRFSGVQCEKNSTIVTFNLLQSIVEVENRIRLRTSSSCWKVEASAFTIGGPMSIIMMISEASGAMYEELMQFVA